jgi:hypothetical protein
MRRPLIDPEDEPILRWGVGGIVVATFIPSCLCGILLDKWVIPIVPLIAIGGAASTLASAASLFRKALKVPDRRADRIVIAAFLFGFVVLVISFLLLWLLDSEPRRH